jgi:hypothetical protein
MFSDRRNDGPNISEDLRTLEGAEGSRDLHAQLHYTQVPFGLIVGEGTCEVRKEPQDVISVVAQADQKIVAWPLGFSASSAGSSSQWVLSLMEGKPLSEDRHVFDDDALINRRGEFGLASALRSTLELIGAVEQQAHRTRPRERWPSSWLGNGHNNKSLPDAL